MIDLSSTQKLFIGALLVGMVASYSLFAFRHYLIGPSITIFSPTNGEVVETSLVTLRGKTSNISRLTLNGRQIFTDEDGHFAEQLLLASGYTILEVSAKDRFDRVEKKTIHLTRN